MRTLIIPVLLFVLALLVFLMRRGAFPTINIMNTNSLNWVLRVYTAVLLSSVVVLYMLPKQDFAASTTYLDQFTGIYEAGKAGKLGSTNGVYAKGNWSFEFSGSQLKISSEYPNALIFVQRKDSDDGKLDLIDYVTSSTFDGIDYTDKIKPPKVALVRDELIVKSPGPYQVDYVKFDKDFAAAQFSDESSSQPGSGFLSGEALVLRIPKNLTIDNPQKIVQFVGE